MSFSIDTNLLVYAADAGSAHHARAAEFLAGAMTGSEPCYLTWAVLFAFVRLVTSRVVVEDPFEPGQALTSVDALVGRPHVRVVAERDDFLPEYRRLTDGLGVRGRLVPDAQLAVVLHQHGIRTLHTNDRDFLRFPWLDVRFPLAG